MREALVGLLMFTALCTATATEIIYDKALPGYGINTIPMSANTWKSKTMIHPDQVAVVNSVFTPTEAQVARAQRIIDAFTEAEARGSSSIQLDGQFIDYPIVYVAQRVLAISKKLAGLAK